MAEAKTKSKKPAAVSTTKAAPKATKAKATPKRTTAKTRQAPPKPKQIAEAPAPKPRKLKRGYYPLTRIPKRDKRELKLPNVFKLTKRTAWVLGKYWRLFLGIMLIYGILDFILVHQLVFTTDVVNLKDLFHYFFTGQFGPAFSNLTLLTVLVQSANGDSETGGVYQTILTIMYSLALIWALRKVLNGTRPRVREAYYQSMAPLVPFLLIFLIMGVQILPLAGGIALYQIVFAGSIAVHLVEQIIWLIIIITMILLSLYWLFGSLFAFFVVTLPDMNMTPIRAVRSASDLVRGLRWSLIRKLLYLSIVLVVGLMAVILPVIIWIPALTNWAFFVATWFAMPIILTYLYIIYREMLQDE